MADVIQPLAGTRYNAAVVDPARVVAPPYDVIDPAEQDALYARDPHNVIRLILGRAGDADSPADNRYTRAAADLAAWRAENAFVQDRPAYYLYRQTFNEFGRDGGRRVERLGFFARILLSEWGKRGVYPHEKTLAGPKEDRFRLMNATDGNLEPIFGLLADPAGDCARFLAECAAADAAPVVDATEADGCENKLYLVDAPAVVERLRALCRDPRVYIADGHHRYETGLRYRDEVRRRMRDAGRTPPPEGGLDCDYILMLVVPDDDPGLVIWPTHRIVHGLAAFDPAAFLAAAEKHFTVAPHVSENVGGGVEGLTAAMAASPSPAFGFLLPDGRRYLLAARDADAAMAARCPDAAPSWRALDVSVLHVLLMEDLLGIDADKLLRKENVHYARTAREAAAAVESRADGAQAAFLVRPTTMAQIRAVAEAGAVMPQKSTYFYPKALSGMLFNFFGKP